MNDKYILSGNEAVLEPDLKKWAEWFETNSRIVKQDFATVKFKGQNAGEIRVSTVFLGIDHSFNGGKPMLFETMVFGGPLDQEMDRCSTWEGAEKMHQLMCERVKHFEV